MHLLTENHYCASILLWMENNHVANQPDCESVMKKITEKEDVPYIIIFTDLDGTLLDHSSYGWSSAEPAVNLCKKLSVPVIMVSSKTRAEIDVLRKELGFPFPFISENGGGIFFPAESVQDVPSDTVKQDDLHAWHMGVQYKHLIKSLQEIQDDLGYRLKGFSEMTAEEIAKLTGLDLESSRMASLREFDEPFIIEENDFDINILHSAAQEKDLMISQGGRFFHLHGKYDKGDAVKKIISWYTGLYDQDFFRCTG